MELFSINRRVALALLGCTVLASFAADSATAGSSVAILTSGSSFTPAGWSNLAQTYVGLAATKNTVNTDTRMMGIRQDGGVDILYRFTDDGSYNIYPVPGITTVYSSITADRVTGDRFYAGKPGGGVDVLYADGASILVVSPSEWNQTYAALAATQPGGVTDYRVGAAGAAGVDTLFYLGGWATYDVPGWTTSYTSLTADQTLPRLLLRRQGRGRGGHFVSECGGRFSQHVERHLQRLGRGFVYVSDDRGDQAWRRG